MRSTLAMVAACALVLCGCGTPQPTAPYASEVRDAALSTTIRTDNPDPSVARDGMDLIRGVQPMLKQAVGPSPAGGATVWLLQPVQLDAYMKSRGRLDNTGAFTAISRQRDPQLYTHCMSPTVTPLGDAVQRLHTQFVLGHEYTHAWLNARSNKDIEEGFANWMGARATKDVEIDGVTFDIAERMAVMGCRLRKRAGKAHTVGDLLSISGSDAYAAGAALFFWLYDQRQDDAAFQSAAREILKFGSLGRVDVGRCVGAGRADDKELQARFHAWLDETNAKHDWWWMPVGNYAVGARGADAAVMADDSAGVMMSFAKTGEIPEAARKLDQEFGAPPLARVQELKVVVRGEGLAFDPRFWTKPARGPVSDTDALPFACTIVAGQRSTRAGSNATPLRNGETLTFVCDGKDVVVSSERKELVRWKDAACTPLVIASYGTLKDGRLPVMEFTRTKKVRSD